MTTPAANPNTVEQLVRPDEIESIAFEGPKTPDRGYTIRANYLKAPRNGDALIEVMKDGATIRMFLFPAYKIYNLQAHFSDIVDGEIEKSTRGYEMAAWNGISGAMFIVPDASGQTPAARKDG
jgi:hypothetical protein